MCSLTSTEQKRIRLSNKNYLALPRNRKDSRLKNSIINEFHHFRGNGNKLTKSSSDYCSIASSACSTLSYDFIATNVSMQTDLNSKRNKDCLNLFQDGGLWRSAKLQNIYYRVLTIRCFPFKTGALNDCFLQNICSKNQMLTQNFHSSRKAEHSRFPVLKSAKSVSSGEP